MRTFFKLNHGWAVFVSSLILIVSSGIVYADWPSFRGSEGGTASGDPPVEWNIAEGANVAWMTAIPGLGHSSPIVSGDRIYVTTAVSASGEEQLKTGSGREAGIASATDVGVQEWRLYALDRRTGEIVWQQTADRSEPRAQRHFKNSYASATPATDGEHIVGLMGSQGLFCYDTEGELLWKKDLGQLDLGMANDAGTNYGSASSPVIDGNRVIVQNDRRGDSWLAAFDIATGEEVWRSARDEESSWATPLIVRTAERGLVITNSPLRVRANDLETGREVWWMDDGAELKVASPVLAGDSVIVTGGFPSGTRPIYAIPLNAEGELTSSDLSWTAERGSAYTMTPLLYDGLLYVGRDNGVLAAIDPSNGEEVYEMRVGKGLSSFSSSPVAASGRIYIVDEEGTVYVVRAGREFELLATNTLDAITLATPAIDGNLLVIRTRSHVVGLGRP